VSTPIANVGATLTVNSITVELYRLLGGMAHKDNPLAHYQAGSDTAVSNWHSLQLQVIGYFGRGVIDRADHLTPYVPAVQTGPSVPKHLPIEDACSVERNGAPEAIKRSWRRCLRA
jgi:hypothetical protein